MGKRILSKIFLLILNIIYFLAAVAILTLGSLSLSGDPAILDLLNLIEDTATIEQILDVKALTVAASAYLVALGSLAIILSFIGSCASFKSGGCILVFFGISKFVIILFNLALIMYNSIVPYHGKDSVQTLLLDNLKDNYLPTTTSGDILLPAANSSAHVWATMEFEQACCAAGGYEDYLEVPVLNMTGYNISSTCCMQIQQYGIPGLASEFTNLTACLTSGPNHVNTKGCVDYVMSIIINYRQVYILVAASFIALEVLLIGFTVRVHGDDRRGVDVL